MTGERGSLIYKPSRSIRDGLADHTALAGADGIGVDERVGIELNSILRMGRYFVMKRFCNDE